MAGRVWRRPPPHALAVVDAVHLAGGAALVAVAADGPAARGDEGLVAGCLEGGQRRVGVVLGVVAARVCRGRRTAAGGTRRTVGMGWGYFHLLCFES